MAKYAAAVDQGTTSTRFMVFDHEGRVVCFDQKEHEQIYPKPGWVEHSPDEIWERTQSVIKGGLAKGNIDPKDIAEHKRPMALRDERFLAEQALSHGEHVGAFANLLLQGRAPWTRMRRVLALLGLVRRFGAERVDDACKRAIEHDMHDVERLRRMLEQPATVDDGPRARVIPIARYLRPSSTWAIQKNEGEQQ